MDYLTQEEKNKIKILIDLIGRDSLMEPMANGKKANGEVMSISEISSYNNMVAWHNEGIRELLTRLHAELFQEGYDGKD